MKYLYQVRHPELGETTVEAEDRYGAIKAACIKWEEAFSELAGYCTVRKLGTAARPQCRRCGSTFGEPGDAAGMCMECRRKEHYFEREKRDMFRYYDTRRKRERLA